MKIASIIRATGACVGKESRSGSDVLLLGAIDMELEITEVILADAELKDLVDDRQ